MLLSYGAKNFFCFKEWCVIDLNFNKNVPEEISNGKAAAPVLCFKGANAAGKTNGLKVLAFLIDFCKNSFLYIPNSKIPLEPFFDNNDISEFFLEFISNNKKYKYELQATKEKVFKETLTLQDTNTILLLRENNKILKNQLYNNSEIIFKDNASFISTLRQYGIQEINDIIQFFEKASSNVSYYGYNSMFDKSVDCNKWYYDNPEDLSYIVNRIREFDTGIEDIKIEKKQGFNNEIVYIPVFFHKTLKEKYPLSIQFESSGTQWLYTNLLFFAYSLKAGSVLLMDELDLNLHSDILPELVKDFLNPKINKNNAQLLFTTHNNDIMEITKKYQTYLFNKENGESYCYRLDELPSSVIRNDRPIKNLYEKGLLGGIPKIHE